MKTTNTLRILAGLTFLIFFCPFFQMCSDEDISKSVKKTAIEHDSIAGETTPPKIDETSAKKWEQAYLEEHRPEWTFNAYEISNTYGKALAEDGVERRDLKDPAFWFVIFFILSVVTSLFLLIVAFFKKLRLTFILSCLNVLFIILYSLFLFVGDTPIEHLHQVKFGYYLFVINSIALIFVSYKAKNQPKHAV